MKAFIIRFFAIYFGLLLLVHLGGLKESYRNAFASVYGTWFSDINDDTRLTMSAFTPKDTKEQDDIHFNLVSIALENQYIETAKRQGLSSVEVPAVNWTLSSWAYSFMPLILLLALIIATPTHWKRKLLALGLGILVFHLIIAFRLRSVLLHTIDESPHLANLSLNVVTKNIYAFFLYNRGIEFGLLLALAIWVLIAFRKEDFLKLLKTKH